MNKLLLQKYWVDKNSEQLFYGVCKRSLDHLGQRQSLLALERRRRVSKTSIRTSQLVIDYCYIVIGPNLWFKCSGDPIDVAELLDVCRLEVYGKLDTAYLSPGTLYEVVFVVKLNAKEYGWEEPVEFTLETPAGDKHTRNVDLMQKQRGTWLRSQPVNLEHRLSSMAT
ncbi:hypothetical protein ACFX2B_035792 [Malus domestica]